MSNTPAIPTTQENAAFPEAGGRSSQHLVHELMHFGISIRYRKNLLLAVLAAGCLLGGLYYATATCYYAAKASLLIVAVEPGAELTSTAMAPEGPRQQIWMPTYEALIPSAKVLSGALAHLRPEDRVDFGDVSPEKWEDRLRKNLSARTIRNTNILEITYQSRNSAAAVAIVNAIVQSYVDFVDQTHKSTAGEIIRILTKEKAELVTKLAGKEQELQRVRNEVCDLGIGAEAKSLHPIIQRAVSFNDALIEARKSRAKLEASRVALEETIRAGGDLQQQLVGLSDAVGKELLLSRLGFGARDAMVQANVEQAVFEDRTKLNLIQEHLGRAHPLVRATAERIRMGEEQLADYQERVNQRMAQMRNGKLAPMLVEMVEQQLQQARHNERSLEIQYEEAQTVANSFSGQLSRLESIKHELQWLRNLHDVLLNRIANIDLKHEGQDVRATVVSEPKKTDAPVSPRLFNVLIATLGSALIVGLLAVYTADILDDRFRSAEELQRQLGIPILAMVREMDRRGAPGLDGLQIYALPDAAESESFRTLRTALALLSDEPRQIVVSSAEPGDGKTTVVANLALAVAQSGKRTLLIDADLRRPGLTALLGMRGVDGLSGILRAQGEIGELARAVIRNPGVPGFDVIPSGPKSANPAELLASARFAELLAWAEVNYDRVFVDSAPALVTSDTAVIGRMVDGVLLVVQPQKNRRRLVSRVAESFALLKIPVLGIAVNRVSTKGEGYYSYGYGSGYSYEYSDRSQDGPTEPGAHEKDATPVASLELKHPSLGAAPSSVDPSRPRTPIRRVA